jgi:uncharacterized protein YbaR (Trm112 family)
VRCPKCDGELLQHEKASSVSAGGLLGALVGLIGLFALFGNALVGIGLIILGVILGTTMRSKKLVLICPACKTVTPVL